SSQTVKQLYKVLSIYYKQRINYKIKREDFQLRHMDFTEHIIQQLSLTVTLVKIKEHSRDFFNDKADILAKDGYSQLILQFNYSAMEDLQLTMLFNNTPIEFSSRKFWKDLNSAEHFSSFINL
ncbi:16308_t:CDS:1, partial [Funneliformis geosporum]